LIRVPITRPAMGEAEIEAIARVVRSGWLSQGPEVAAFETELAAAVGATHAVAVSNCTVALELALRCLNVGPGDDVVTVSHSFIATANSIKAVGARPVFADVHETSFGMSPASLERVITSKTKAILAVHQIGFACELEPIVEIARSRGIALVEDAACAIGSEVRVGATWERIGKPHGVMACFSFHPRKVVTAGEGGMITTRDPAIATRLRLLRQHAMSVPDTVRHHSDRVIFESYTEPAFNFRMTDMQAAIARCQLARLDAIVAERRRIAAAYSAHLQDNRRLAAPRDPPWSRTNWQSYPVRLREGTGMSQIEAMQFLMDRGIAVKRGVSNAHQEPAYSDRTTWTGGDLSVSERLRDTTMLVPLFHGMTTGDQDRVMESVSALGSADLSTTMQ
jgi:perosamine synthetase